MEKIKFESEVYLIGTWNNRNSDTINDVAYYLYLRDVKKEKDSGKWLTYESTRVLDQLYFMGSRTSEDYYNKSLLMIRNRKLEKLL
jgi:hypothetical protein